MGEDFYQWKLAYLLANDNPNVRKLANEIAIELSKPKAKTQTAEERAALYARHD